VTIEIYDVNGRHVRTLVDREQASGEQSVVWDGRDDGGRLMATGVYLYRMTAPGIETASKMLLLK
jgi:flagellar hook assembly protein FlgD